MNGHTAIQRDYTPTLNRPQYTFPDIRCIGCNGLQPDPERGYCEWCIVGYALSMDANMGDSR